MCAWDEPDDLLEISLSSLRQQTLFYNYPDYVSIIVVGCHNINLDICNKYADRVICMTKPGKLLARDQGIKASSTDIIVAADADVYFPPNFLNSIVKPFNDSNVVAVSTCSSFGMMDSLVYIPSLLWYSTRLTGRASAFRKSAYLKIGGFDIDIDNKAINGNYNILVQEEEVNFRKRLSRIGRIKTVFVPHYHLSWFDKNRGLRKMYSKM